MRLAHFRFELINVFQLAARRNNVEILKRIWVWAEEKQFNPNELKNELLLYTDSYGYTAWHRAAAEGSLEALELLWSLAKEAKLNTDEFLLAQTRKGYTAFLLAARNNSTILETEISCAYMVSETQK